MSEELQRLLDKQAVIDTVNAMVVTADRKDWQTCRRLFMDELLLDHDAHDGEASKMKAEELMESWQKLFDKFEVTQHAVSNHQVELRGDSATCRSYVHALHTAKSMTTGENYYTTFGTYVHELIRTEQGWKIASVVYKQRYAQGNSAVFYE
jgi:SnoaL-like domain